MYLPSSHGSLKMSRDGGSVSSLGILFQYLIDFSGEMGVGWGGVFANCCLQFHLVQLLIHLLPDITFSSFLSS